MAAVTQLFVKNGKPLHFYLRPCKPKAELFEKIKEHGGMSGRNSRDSDYLLYLPGDISSSNSAVIIDYIDDCIRKNKLLDVKKYTYGERSVSSSAIRPRRNTDLSSQSQSDNDSSDSNFNINHANAFHGKKGFYTISEDIIIIENVLRLAKSYSINGNNLWENLQSQNVLQRTAMSLKERFLKKILPQIEEYQIDDPAKNKLKMLASGKATKVRKALRKCVNPKRNTLLMAGDSIDKLAISSDDSDDERSNMKITSFMKIKPQSAQTDSSANNSSLHLRPRREAGKRETAEERSERTVKNSVMLDSSLTVTESDHSPQTDVKRPKKKITIRYIQKTIRTPKRKVVLDSQLMASPPDTRSQTQPVKAKRSLGSSSNSSAGTSFEIPFRSPDSQEPQHNIPSSIELISESQSQDDSQTPISPQKIETVHLSKETIEPPSENSAEALGNNSDTERRRTSLRRKLHERLSESSPEAVGVAGSRSPLKRNRSTEVEKSPRKMESTKPNEVADSSGSVSSGRSLRTRVIETGSPAKSGSQNSPVIKELRAGSPIKVLPEIEHISISQLSEIPRKPVEPSPTKRRKLLQSENKSCSTVQVLTKIEEPTEVVTLTDDSQSQQKSTLTDTQDSINSEALVNMIVSAQTLAPPIPPMEPMVVAIPSSEVPVRPTCTSPSYDPWPFPAAPDESDVADQKQSTQPNQKSSQEKNSQTSCSSNKPDELKLAIQGPGITRGGITRTPQSRLNKTPPGQQPVYEKPEAPRRTNNITEVLSESGESEYEDAASHFNIQPGYSNSSEMLSQPPYSNDERDELISQVLMNDTPRCDAISVMNDAISADSSGITHNCTTGGRCRFKELKSSHTYKQILRQFDIDDDDLFCLTLALGGNINLVYQFLQSKRKPKEAWSEAEDRLLIHYHTFQKSWKMMTSRFSQSQIANRCHYLLETVELCPSEAESLRFTKTEQSSG